MSSSSAATLARPSSAKRGSRFSTASSYSCTARCAFSCISSLVMLVSSFGFRSSILLTAQRARRRLDGLADAPAARPAALRHLRAPAAAPFNYRASLAHQRVHVAGRVRRAREDEPRLIVFARAEQRDRARVRRERRREQLQGLSVAPVEAARDDARARPPRFHFFDQLLGLDLRRHAFERAHAT